MRPLYRAGQGDTCTVRSQPVYRIGLLHHLPELSQDFFDSSRPIGNKFHVEYQWYGGMKVYTDDWPVNYDGYRGR